MKKKLYVALITAILFISLENVYSMEQKKDSSGTSNIKVSDFISTPYDGTCSEVNLANFKPKSEETSELEELQDDGGKTTEFHKEELDLRS